MADDRSSKLVIFFLVFLALITFPVLGIFDRRETLLGFPLLYFYFFFVWLGLILAMVLVFRKKRR